MNFARFNFENEFRNLDKILYLDCDMIVKAPIENLYYYCNIHKYPFYANRIGTFKAINDINNVCLKKYNINENSNYFNAGVYSDIP